MLYIDMFTMCTISFLILFGYQKYLIKLTKGS